MTRTKHLNDYFSVIKIERWLTESDTNSLIISYGQKLTKKRILREKKVSYQFKKFKTFDFDAYLASFTCHRIKMIARRTILTNSANLPIICFFIIIGCLCLTILMIWYELFKQAFVLKVFSCYNLYAVKPELAMHDLSFLPKNLT